MTSWQIAKLIQRLVLCFAVICLALDFGPAIAQDVENVQISTRVGQMLILKLPGQPDSGYRWRMIAEESQGRELVNVRELGWTFQRSQGLFSVREVGTLRYTVETRAAGKAYLVFEYRRMVPEPPPGRRRIVEIDIAPDAPTN